MPEIKLSDKQVSKLLAINSQMNELRGLLATKEQHFNDLVELVADQHDLVVNLPIELRGNVLSWKEADAD